MKGCEPAPTCRDLPVLVHVSDGAAWIQPMVVWWLTLAESICLAEWFWLHFVPGYLNSHSTPEASWSGSDNSTCWTPEQQAPTDNQQKDQDQPQEKNQNQNLHQRWDHEHLLCLPCRPPALLQPPAYRDRANLSATRTSGPLGSWSAPETGMAFDL